MGTLTEPEKGAVEMTSFCCLRCGKPCIEASMHEADWWLFRSGGKVVGGDSPQVIPSAASSIYALHNECMTPAQRVQADASRAKSLQLQKEMDMRNTTDNDEGAE